MVWFARSHAEQKTHAVSGPAPVWSTMAEQKAWAVEVGGHEISSPVLPSMTQKNEWLPLLPSRGNGPICDCIRYSLPLKCSGDDSRDAPTQAPSCRKLGVKGNGDGAAALPAAQPTATATTARAAVAIVERPVESLPTWRRLAILL